MYELFVLGELMTGDKHGYMLQDILKNAAGPTRQISSGTLYPLLSRLVDGGLIHLRHEEESEGGRTRKVYGVTEAGRARFRELMEEPLPYDGETERLFGFKMVYFQYVGKDVRLSCLRQYASYLEKNRKYVVDFEAKLLAHKPEPEKQRVQLLRVFDRRKTVWAAEIEWVKREIERVEKEE
ncbi:PadR family transcriptional regulator [Paenibacillus flagellatus]|uniref:PadR family transcriptional regulator n=1 Tax=Paenibacillus flagellatus TaxID=2211139 RepID=A0A2V5K9R2_9BACL|nr:PadR family transcriptional regulator [Paenibacillus flagellatus]PYI56128.1 PadR family transcriptional regulator [Paenibacillus flagellatus]